MSSVFLRLDIIFRKLPNHLNNGTVFEGHDSWRFRLFYLVRIKIQAHSDLPNAAVAGIVQHDFLGHPVASGVILRLTAQSPPLGTNSFA